MSKRLNTLLLPIAMGYLFLYMIHLDARELPTVQIKGGRYYINIEGVRVKKEDGSVKYWTTRQTAEAFAINLALRSNKIHIIEQPTLTVTVTYPEPNEPSNLSLSWETPTSLEDGSPLLPNEITGYLLKYSSQENTTEISQQISGGTTTQYLVSDLEAGIYTFTIATITHVTGTFSSPIIIEIL